MIETPIPGLSTKVINSTLYYEKYGFSARVSNRYRDEFVGEVPNFDATLALNNRERRNRCSMRRSATSSSGVR